MEQRTDYTIRMENGSRIRLEAEPAGKSEKWMTAYAEAAVRTRKRGERLESKQKIKRMILAVVIVIVVIVTGMVISFVRGDQLDNHSVQFRETSRRQVEQRLWLLHWKDRSRYRLLSK